MAQIGQSRCGYKFCEFDVIHLLARISVEYSPTYCLRCRILDWGQVGTLEWSCCWNFFTVKSKKKRENLLTWFVSLLLQYICRVLVLWSVWLGQVSQLWIGEISFEVLQRGIVESLKSCDISKSLLDDEVVEVSFTGYFSSIIPQIKKKRTLLTNDS